MTPDLQTLARPETVPAPRGRNPIALDQESLAFAVGLIALLLPVVLWLGAFWAPLCRQASISHYYYMPFLGSVLVAAMGFISIFMWNYPGHTRSDRIAARIGSLGAIVLAIFPAFGDGCAETAYLSRPLATVLVEDGPRYSAEALDFGYTFGGWLTTRALHWGGAAALFGVLTWFCLWSFRRDNGEGVMGRGETARMTASKRLRNRIYLGCGLVMAAMFVALPLAGGNPDGETGLFPVTFLLEAIALAAFGVSWLVKGRVLRGLRD